MVETQNTQNSSDGGGENVIPGVEDVIAASQKTIRDTGEAERLVIEKLLGVDMGAVGLDKPLDIANRILQRISSILIDTREQVAELNAPELGVEIQREVLKQMNQGENDQGRIGYEAVMSAVRNVFPAAVVRELVERLWPTVYRADRIDYEIKTKSSDLVLKNVKLRNEKHTVIIDTNHILWKQTDPSNLAGMLDGRTLSSCGIRVVPDDIGREYVLSSNQNEVQNILNMLSTEIFTLNSTAEDPAINNYHGYRVQLKLKYLLAQQMQNLGQHFQDAQALSTFLNNQDHWEQFVDVIPTNIATGAAPNYLDDTLRNNLAERAFALMPNTTVTMGNDKYRFPLGLAIMNLHDVAKRQYALHRFSATFRKGETNPWDVATAMAMIQQHGELRDVLGGEGNTEEIRQSANRLQLVRYLDQLRSVDVPHVPRAPADCTLAYLTAEMGRITGDLNNLNSNNFTTTTNLLPKISVRNKNIDSVRRQLIETSDRVSRAQSALTRAGQILEQVYTIIQGQPGINITSFTLLADIASPAVDPNALRISTNFNAIADQVQQEFPTLRDERYYRDELKKLQDNASEVPEGTEAIHAIYQNYFKQKGLSEREAKNAANALMARNAMDSHMDNIVEEVAEASYPDMQGATLLERFAHGIRGLSTNERRIRNAVNTVAFALAIPTNDNEPALNNVNAEKLIQFYYALKQLLDASGKMRLPEDDRSTRLYLNKIGKRLMRDHAEKLLYACKGRLPGDVGQDDKAVETILGQSQKLEAVLKELLRIDAPPAHAAAIQKAVSRAKELFEWKRRTFVIDRLVGDKWSVKQAIMNKNNPLSLRSIWFGKWGILGAPWGAAKKAPEAAGKTGKAVWGERKGIAAGAILGGLFMGPAGVLLGAGAGGMWRKAVSES